MVPAIIRDLNPVSCAEWRNRVVHISPISAHDLMAVASDTRVVTLPSSMRFVLPRQGISLPGIVAALESPSFYSNAHLRWHEMAHQHQYNRDGVFAFFKNYTTDFHTGLLKGCTIQNAYSGIKYEIEADIAADSIHMYTDSYFAILDPVQVRLGDVPERCPILQHKPGSRNPHGHTTSWVAVPCALKKGPPSTSYVQGTPRTYTGFDNYQDRGLHAK